MKKELVLLTGVSFALLFIATMLVMNSNTTIVGNVVFDETALNEGVVVHYTLNLKTLGGASVSGNVDLVNGVSGKAFDFDGLEGSVELSDSSIGDLPSSVGENISYSLWFKTSYFDDNHRPLLFKDLAGSAYMRLFMYRSEHKSNRTIGFQYVDESDNNIIANSDDVLNDGGWHNIVAVLEYPKTMKIYVDGVLNDEKQAASNFIGSSNPLVIGDRASTIWNGSIDEFMIYNKSLSASEVTALFDEQALCTPDWVAVPGNCSSNEEASVTYEDEDNCNLLFDKPADDLVNCDYDGNGLIGAENDITDINVKIEVEIDGKDIKTSSNYTGKKDITLVDENNTLVEYEWDFDDGSLDFNRIDIEKQSSTGRFGYLIINGIDVDKTVYVDRILDTSRLCIKDSEITDIDDISSNCDEDDETILSCPGVKNDYNCSISSSRFKITGLEHSAITEYGANGVCIPKWDCSEWQDCLGDEQVRLCVDVNGCGNNINKPNETQVCGASCTPIWSCSDWEPESCSIDDEQTRSCADTNYCDDDSNIPTESRDCPVESNLNVSLFIIVVVIILIVGIAIAAVLYFLNKKADEELDDGLEDSNKPSGKPPVSPTNSVVTKPVVKKNIISKQQLSSVSLVSPTASKQPTTKQVVAKPAAKPIVKSVAPVRQVAKPVAKPVTQQRPVVNLVKRPVK